MGKNKKDKKGKKNQIKTNKTLTTTLFQLSLIILAFAFYYNSLNNTYSFGDDAIKLTSVKNHPNPVIKDIPEIWVTPYASDKPGFTAYRPLSRTLFAIEYQFTSSSKKIPQISHFINLLLYIIGILLLFGLLRRLFKNHDPWFSFLIAALFLAHPIHTQVVDSLNNRDVLLAFIFGIIALHQFIKWIDHSHVKYLIFGTVSFFLALLSNEQAFNLVFIFPLTVYFFTDARKKQVWGLFGLQAVVALIAVLLPLTWLSSTDIPLSFVENPLVKETGILSVTGTAFIVMGWALKMLAFPFPLRFYYGYDMIERAALNNSWMWLSVAVVVILLVFAIRSFRQKNILSFAILFFFLSFLGFSNLFVLIPGIVSEKFLFVPSLAIAILIVWFLYSVFNPVNGKIKRKVGIWAVAILIFILYGTLTINRNTQWLNEKSIFDFDLPKLEKSAYINNLYASKRLEPIANALKEKASPYKFILPVIKEVETYTWRALDIDTTYADAWMRLGYVNAELHGEQSLRRVESFTKSGKKDELEKEKLKVFEYFSKADFYYNKALEYGGDSARIYFLKSDAAAIQQYFDQEAINLIKAIQLDPDNREYKADLIQAYLHGGRFNDALAANEQFRKKYPDSDIPYLNLGGYYYFKGDTIKAIKFYKKAIEKGTKPEVGKLLARYYSRHGNIDSMDYFLQKAYEARSTYHPEK